MSVKGQGNLLHRSTIAIVCLRTGGGASGWERGAGGGGKAGAKRRQPSKRPHQREGRGGILLVNKAVTSEIFGIGSPPSLASCAWDVSLETMVLSKLASGCAPADQ